MKINPFGVLKLVVFFGGTVGLAGLCAGCHGQDDAPTNTATSSYVGNGKSAADQMGMQRAQGHRPRLPGKGAGN